MCLYPKIIGNKKYVGNKKNGGIVPPLPTYKMKNGKEIEDERVKYVSVGCQKCMECMKKKSREWQVRLQEEIKTNKNGYFVTLTFSNESIKELSKEIKTDGYERDNEIATKAVRRFLERWRKKHKKSVRHWLITELGHENTENIHLHGLIFTDHKEDIAKIWQYGYIYTGEYVNEKTINYIIKYITKTDLKHGEYKAKILTTAGIGREYKNSENAIKNKYKELTTKEIYTCRNGSKIALPIYYRNKIYTEEEREKLWLEKLDNKMRYINGQKIDVSENEDEYFEILKTARELNKELRYGNNTINWEQKRYQRELRNIKHKERINAPPARGQHK